MKVEVVIFVPPFLLTSLSALLLFMITREKLKWKLAISMTLSLTLSVMIGILSYIIMTMAFGCPTCKVG